MSILEHPTVPEVEEFIALPETDTNEVQAPAEPGHDSQPSKKRRPNGVAAWVLVAGAAAGVGVLVAQLVNDDSGSDPPEAASISDPKDRPGYRSPTITRQLTTGDAKDHAGWTLPTATPAVEISDPKDRPGYVSPTAAPSAAEVDRSMYVSSTPVLEIVDLDEFLNPSPANERPAYFLSDAERQAGDVAISDPKDRPGYVSPTAAPSAAEVDRSMYVSSTPVLQIVDLDEFLNPSPANERPAYFLSDAERQEGDVAISDPKDRPGYVSPTADSSTGDCLMVPKTTVCVP